MQKATNCSTDQNLNSMGASLRTQSLLENANMSTSGTWFSWSFEMEITEKKDDIHELWTPNLPYAPQPMQLFDVNPHERNMLSSPVRQIIAMSNGHVVRELSDNGQIRENTVLAIKWQMFSQRAIVSVITASMHEPGAFRPWASVSLSKLVEDRRHQEQGRAPIVPTGPDALCMLINNEIPSAVIQCAKTLQKAFPELGLRTHAPDLIGMLTSPMAATEAATALAAMGASRKSLEEPMTMTTNPVLLQISELFLSKEFQVSALIDMATKAPDCPSIAHDPIRVGEWALISGILKKMLISDPNLRVTKPRAETGTLMD